MRSQVASTTALSLLLVGLFTTLAEPTNYIDTPVEPDMETVYSGTLKILEPLSGWIMVGMCNLTFEIKNTGSEVMEFPLGDVYNATNVIWLEIRWSSPKLWNWILWSSSNEGLSLMPGETCVQTVFFDPYECEKIYHGYYSPYGEASIILAHYRLKDEYSVPGELGVTESRVSLQETTHEGDLVIDGTQTFVIENCNYTQIGRIIVRDSGSLVIMNSTITMEMDYWLQHDIVIEGQGFLLIENGKIVCNYGFFHMSVTEQARTRITSSELDVIIFCQGFSQVNIAWSAITSIRMWFGSSRATISNSSIGNVYLAFDRDTTGSLENLKPGLHEHWNVYGNNTVTNVQFYLTLENVTINGWELTLDYFSPWTVSTSVIDRIALDLRGISARITDLRPGFYEELRLGSSIFRNTSVAVWTPSMDNAGITFVNSTTGPMLHGVGNCTLVDCEIVFHLWIGGFLGEVSFDRTTVMTWIRIEDSEVSITGNVDLKNAEIDLLNSSNVTRKYGLFARYPNKDPVENLELKLFEKNHTVAWNGTTDSLGHADFNLTFTAGNYTDTLRLEAVEGNYCSSANVGFLSDTPVELKMRYFTDLNGDGTVNIVDISIVAKAFGSRQAEVNWNQIADLDKNGWVNIVDITLVAKDYGKTV